MLDREAIIAIGISLVFTPRGLVPDRVGDEDGRGVRWEWWLSERPRLLLLGNTQDPLLESLWAVMPEMRLCGTARTINFDLATGLNFSLYVERPRLGTPLQRQARLVDDQSTAKREPIPDTDPPSPVVWRG